MKICVSCTWVFHWVDGLKFVKFDKPVASGCQKRELKLEGTHVHEQGTNNHSDMNNIGL